MDATRGLAAILRDAAKTPHLQDEVRASFAAGRRRSLRRKCAGGGLSRKHEEAGARKVHDDLAGAGIVPANGDVLRRQRHDLASDFDLAVIVRPYLYPVAGLGAS